MSPLEHCNPIRYGAASVLGTLVLLGLTAGPARAIVRIGNICHVKGQEPNKLVGYGLVVGLPGTGDNGKFGPLIRSLAMALKNLKHPIGDAPEILGVKNVAVVVVTATVPASGAREGERIDVQVSSIGNAKSLAGGRLWMTPLQGPQPGSDAVYAYAEGPVIVETKKVPTEGRVIKGARLLEEIFNLFHTVDPMTKQESFTLVVDDAHASFRAAADIARVVNEDRRTQVGRDIASAIDPKNVKVLIPTPQQDDRVAFIAQILHLSLGVNPSTEARVIISRKTGTLIFTAEVEISPVVINHPNLVIVTPGPKTGEDEAPAELRHFAALKHEQGSGARLQELVRALDAIKVPAGDVISIIQDLYYSGKLHARLIMVSE